MEIELPLADCPRNLGIFGHLTRKDVDMGDVFFDVGLSQQSYENDIGLMVWRKNQGREGFAARIPLRPGGGTTNSMNDTDVSIVSFSCACS